MATLTIASMGTLGDHFPFFALGMALVQQGHTVRYAGPSYLRERVEECGMQFFPARPEISPDLVRSKPESYNHWRRDRGGPESSADSWEGTRLFERMEFTDCMHDVAVATRGADLLVCSRLLPVGRMVSDLTGTPWITACVVPWFFPTAGTAAAAGIDARRAKEKIAPVTREFRDRIHQLRRELGLSAIDAADEDQLFESNRVLLATSPHFGEPTARPGQSLVQTGFWLHHPPGWANNTPSADLLRLWERGDDPLVLAFSSQPMENPQQMLDAHLEAARLLDRPILVQSGWAKLDSPLLQEMYREGKAFPISEGPQEEIFFHASAVITHGGIGTVARALTCGAPLLVEPYGNDQFYNARQVLGMGVGAAMNPHHLEAATLATVLESKVTTPHCRERARQTGAELAAQQGVRSACETIEGWLKSPAA
ncbi:glycosyltransferase [Roseimicrobium sp. ORNL1]|uniref:glycosyltransferase n=1 Tax=Roseimicrobium sp. ORNL1 TaxID=2711231 RepID=UPI0013E1A456|nr:glycosyltransferase [Roseimicrobium sp. ORNL1]QIF05007.1 glycosyltransferase family 1 protein [Roseimicrobium sp. ORNL1]